MINKSGLKPLGRAVLVMPYKPEVRSSIIEIPESAKVGMDIVEQRAVVIEVGANCWHDEPEPRAKAGDRVLIAKFSGHMATGTNDGEQYRFVNDRDIFAAIEVE